MRRVYTAYITTAANTSKQDFTISNPTDGYRVQHVKRVYVGISTSGVSVAFMVKSQPKALVDCTRFATGNHPVDVDFDIPATLPLVVETIDLAGSPRTNVPIMIEYDVDNDV